MIKPNQDGVAHECICTKTCDCECSEPEAGTALVSNECPVHNEYPHPHPDCPATAHYAARSFSF